MKAKRTAWNTSEWLPLHSLYHTTYYLNFNLLEKVFHRNNTHWKSTVYFQKKIFYEGNLLEILSPFQRRFSYRIRDIQHCTGVSLRFWTGRQWCFTLRQISLDFNLFITKKNTLMCYGRQWKPCLQLANLPGAWPLMKPLVAVVSLHAW